VSERNGFKGGYHAWGRIRILTSSSIRVLSFSSCFSFETKERSALSVLARLKDARDSPSRTGTEFSAAEVDLELHEKGDEINLVKVWSESLGRRESVGTEIWEEEVESITPSEVGGLGSKSWGDTY